MSKKKKKKTVGFKHQFLEYDLTKISKSKARVKVLLGKRSIGKTYTISNKCLEQYFADDGKRVMNVRLCRKVEMVGSITSALLGGPFQKYSDRYGIETETILKGLRALYCINKETGERLTDYPMFLVCALKSSDDIKQAYRDIEVDEVHFIMDEVIAENQSEYLPNEVERLTSVMSTIARKRKNTLYLLGNAVSLMSPILMHFNIDKTISDHPEVKYTDGYDDKGNLIYSLEIYPDDAFEGQVEDIENSALSCLGVTGTNKYWEVVQSSRFNDSKLLVKNLDGLPYRQLYNIKLKDDSILGVCSVKDWYYVTDRANSDEFIYTYCEDARNAFGGSLCFNINTLKRSEWRQLFDAGSILYKNIRVKNQFLDLVRY